MDLGADLYFLVVFVFGGLLLLAVTIYLLREFLIRGDRPVWSARSRGSKAIRVAALLLFAGLLFVPLHMVWNTRIAAVPGRYSTSGVWGHATLEFQRDGSFIETWYFVNEYNGKPEGDGSMQGHWRNEGRDWLTRDIVLEPFTPLAEYDREQTYQEDHVIVEGYGGATSIDVDSGANITFWK